MLADALRQRRTVLGTKWRRLPVGRQALLVMAHLRKGETCADLARGFQLRQACDDPAAEPFRLRTITRRLVAHRVRDLDLIPVPDRVTL